MTYTAEHILITVLFDSYNSTEHSQFQLRATFAGAPAQPSNTLGGNVQTELTNWWNGAAPYGVSAYCRFWRFLGHKISWIGTDGKLKPGSTVQFNLLTTPIAGLENGANTTHFAPQCSLVATFLTAIPRGHGSHGRIFPPPSCTQLQSDGRVTTGAQDAVGNNIALLLTRLNTYAEIGSCSVFSNVGAGVTSPITSVRTGAVIDTHRSRRRSLPEAGFRTAAVTP